MNSLAKKTENKLFELYDINDLIIRGGIKIISSWIREHDIEYFNYIKEKES